MMQELCHRARTFIISQKGCTGFINYFDIRIWFKTLLKEVYFVKALGIQRVYFEEMVRTFSELKNANVQIKYLQDNCKAAYTLACKKTGNVKEYNEIMDKAKSCRTCTGSDLKNYVDYATVYLPVRFYELVQVGALKDGEKELEYGGVKGQYKGQIDKDGKAAGIGFHDFLETNNARKSYEGAFWDDKWEGIGVVNMKDCFEGEFKEGQRNGKLTCHYYSQSGYTFNTMFENNKYVQNSQSEDIRYYDIKRNYKLDYPHGNNEKQLDFNEKDNYTKAK